MYTHKATTPGDEREQFERTVYCDGKIVGRIHQFTFGPQKGQYWWHLDWFIGDNTGVADTKDEALDIIKERHRNAG